MHIYVYIHIHIYVYIYTYIFISTYVLTQAYMYKFVVLYTYIQQAAVVRTSVPRRSTNWSVLQCRCLQQQTVAVSLPTIIECIGVYLLQCVCCSMLHVAAVCCSLLHGHTVIVYHNVLQHVAACHTTCPLELAAVRAMCGSVLQCVAEDSRVTHTSSIRTRSSVWRCVAVCCSVLQCVAVNCSELQ